MRFVTVVTEFWTSSKVTEGPISIVFVSIVGMNRVVQLESFSHSSQSPSQRPSQVVTKC